MKRILLAVSLILSITAVSAQPKSAADAAKAIEKAKTASQDAKKAAKPATWINLAKAYLEAYEQPTKNLLVNTPQMEVKLFLKDQKVLGSEEFKGPESVYTVDHYADKDLYYNQNGILEMWKVTKPAVEGDLLGEALNCISKAASVDPKGSKAKDLAEMVENIHGKLNNDALSSYLIGDFPAAAKLFEQTVDSYANPVVGKIDSLNTYYTAMVSNMAGDKDNSIKFYNKCIDMGFYQEGNTFSNLAAIYKDAGDIETCKATLEKGFAAYPQSQGILVGLINLYRESGEDNSKLFDLLHTAQKNEPTNASLFYVEGEIYKQLGDIDNAVKYYEKSVEANPTYVFGKLGQGILFYENAVKIQDEAANEFDDAKYMALLEKIDESLAKAIDPFEQAFTMTDDNEVKTAVAEYLKNIYFRLREKNESYAALFEKYNNFLKGE